MFSCQNGPTQFISGSTLPLPKEKHDETLYPAAEQPHKDNPDSDSGFDSLDLPEVPKVLVQPNANVASAPEVAPPLQDAPHPNIDHESSKHSGVIDISSKEPQLEPEKMMQEKSVATKDEQPSVPVGGVKDIQFLPFISPPLQSSASFSMAQSKPSLSRAKSEVNVDLQDVLTAAQAAAESAERAAAAARSAASLAQVRIDELTRKNSGQCPEKGCENPFYKDIANQSAGEEIPHFDHHNLVGNSGDEVLNSPEPHQDRDDYQRQEASSLSSLDTTRVNFDSELHIEQDFANDFAPHQPQRLTSMDDDPYFSYPNLFTSQNPNLGSAAHSSTDNSRSTHEQL